MKISKRQLKRIIREEIRESMSNPKYELMVDYEDGDDAIDVIDNYYDTYPTSNGKYQVFTFMSRPAYKTSKYELQRIGINVYTG